MSASRVAACGARDHALSPGRLDRGGLNPAERAVVRVVGVRDGDFGDWEGVTARADRIAGALGGDPRG